ncbi:MAG: YihY/virulence factor BrkB family protein, partial [Methanothrix sp.]|nr:YihY/virulence factor BrkB family protein [Methanothrix sp.]
MSLRSDQVIAFFKQAISEWLKDDASLLAAALAYYGLFSFVPLLILSLIFINSLFSYGFLDSQVVATSQDLVGQQMPEVAGELIDQAGNQAASFSFTLMSLGLLLFGAVGLFVQTKRAFGIIWKISDNAVPLLDTVISYLRSYLLVALVAFMLLVTSLFSALLMPAAKQIEAFMPIHLGLLRLLTFVVSFLFVTFLFAATYKTLIAVKLRWREVLPGSALAALLLAAGNFCIEAYVGLVNIGSAYGA